jgi:hypothetical protein
VVRELPGLRVGRGALGARGAVDLMEAVHVELAHERGELHICDIRIVCRAQVGSRYIAVGRSGYAGARGDSATAGPEGKCATGKWRSDQCESDGEVNQLVGSFRVE